MLKKSFIFVVCIMLFSCTKEEEPIVAAETNGNATFWVASDLKVGNIAVTCNGSTQIINGYYNSVIPSCGANSCANFNLLPGTYTFTAVGGSLSWNGSITVFSGGCTKQELINDGGGGGGYSLNGKWLASGGLGILISGNTGTFYSFNSGWQPFADKGIISVGSLKIKNIAQVNTSTWNCQVLFSLINNVSSSGIAWSNDGTITMSSDGNSITISATSPFSGDYFAATHTRVN